MGLQIARTAVVDYLPPRRYTYRYRRASPKQLAIKLVPGRKEPVISL